MPISPHAPVATANGVAEYVVVVSNEDDHHAGYHIFAEKVNRKLRAGFKLLGQPFSLHQTMCQAMVRGSDVPPSGDTTIFMKPNGYHS
jgi:hypothetical protein